MDTFPGNLGVLFIELRLSEVHSLKAKRSLIKPLMKRLRSEFNVSVSELDHQDLWQRSLIGASMIGSSRLHVEQCLEKILEFVEQTIDGELIRSRINIF